LTTAAVSPTWLVEEAEAHAAAEEEEDDRERLRRRHVEAREVPDLVKRWSNDGQTMVKLRWSNSGQTVVERRRSDGGERLHRGPGPVEARIERRTLWIYT
jgi:hypothetical protein